MLLFCLFAVIDRFLDNNLFDFAKKMRSLGRNSPVRTLSFSRPLVLLQSDDWGRVGVRDREGYEQLRASGVPLGENPYDYYSLETAEDVIAVARPAEAAPRFDWPSGVPGHEFSAGQPGLPKDYATQDSKTFI